MAILLPIPASTLGLECYVINGRYNQFCCTSQPRSENSDVVQRRERRTVGSLTEAEARIACGNPSVSVHSTYRVTSYIINPIMCGLKREQEMRKRFCCTSQSDSESSEVGRRRKGRAVGCLARGIGADGR
jgi:hypothetical protein